MTTACFLSGMLLFLFFLLPYSALSQNRELDSLWEAYNQASVDSIKLKTLSEISWKYLRVNPVMARSVAQKVLHEGDSLGHHQQEAVALNYKGLSYYLQDENAKALDLFEKSHQRAIELNDSITIAATINNIGLLFIKIGAYEQAFENFQNGVEIAEAFGDEFNLCTGFSNLGSTLELMEEYDKARPYFEKAIELGKKTKNFETIHHGMFHLGIIAEKTGNLEEAKVKYMEAKSGYKQRGNSYGMANLQTVLGRISRLEQNYPLALSYVDSSIQTLQELGYLESIDKAYYEKAHIFLDQGRYREAIQTCKLVLDNDSIGTPNQDIIGNFYRIESDAYLQLGELSKAYESLEAHHEIHDSLFTKEKLAMINNLEVRYQSAKKELENEQLKDQQRRNEIAITQRNIIIAGTGIILVLLLVLAGAIFSNYQQKKANNLLLEEEVKKRTHELQESNNNLTRFAFITSHDLKEPIRNITSFTQLLEKRIQDQYGKNQELQEFAEYVVRNAKQMYTLVDDVQTFTMLEQQSKEKEHFRLSSVLARVHDALNQRIQDSKAEIICKKDGNIYANSSLIFLILKNLIENGIKYNDSSPPQISIDHSIQKNQLIISVKDNGIGIPDSYQAKVFDMFSRLHDRNKYEGSGLGLSICKKIATQLGGKIWVESKEGQGSTFFVSLPLDNHMDFV